MKPESGSEEGASLGDEEEEGPPPHKFLRYRTSGGPADEERTSRGPADSNSFDNDDDQADRNDRQWNAYFKLWEKKQSTSVVNTGDTSNIPARRVVPNHIVTTGFVDPPAAAESTARTEFTKSSVNGSRHFGIKRCKKSRLDARGIKSSGSATGSTIRRFATEVSSPNPFGANQAAVRNMLVDETNANRFEVTVNGFRTNAAAAGSALFNGPALNNAATNMAPAGSALFNGPAFNNAVTNKSAAGSALFNGPALNNAATNMAAPARNALFNGPALNDAATNMAGAAVSTLSNTPLPNAPSSNGEAAKNGDTMDQGPNDVGDAGRFSTASMGCVALMSAEREALYYNMQHPRRGVAIIFCQEHFLPSTKLSQRLGTQIDREKMHEVLQGLGFEVRLCNDYRHQEIQSVIQNVAREDHSDADCLAIVVLSHGEEGTLYAADQQYPVTSLWQPFAADLCPSLAGKPKLFFIQACQGSQLDAGVTLVRRTQTDGPGAYTPDQYRIPKLADFMITQSSVHGFYSWRNINRGSWFIKTLSEKLRAYGTTQPLYSILMMTNQSVATEFQSSCSDPKMHAQKQMPCITSMLTRFVRFDPKPQRTWL